MRTDQELLRDYVYRAAEGAFEELVHRHLDLVFGTAFRGLNDTTAAEEITQNVFIALARKALWLVGQPSLAGWLHKTTLLEVRHFWRGELRRRNREKAAAEMGTTMKDEDSLLTSLRSELDEGLLGLPENERQALILRYFEGLSYRDIGQRLGAREDAARMRAGKALGRLTQYFRRRGYAVPAVSATVAALGAATKAAPANLAVAATRSALASGLGGSLTGLKLLLARFLGLTRAQSAMLCMTLALTPFVWGWNLNRVAEHRAREVQAGFDAVHDRKDEVASELVRSRAESARLDSILADALQTQARYISAAGKMEALKTRVQGTLKDSKYRWPDDLPYVRVPKATVRSLDLLATTPTFSPSGKLAETALEFLGVTGEEKAPTEQALADYWRGVQDLMTTEAYETNLPGAQPGRVTKTVVVPPMGDSVKTLAADTRQQLTSVLGSEREQLLFAGWDQGGIQIFWPGNLWDLAKNSQTFEAWVEPASPGDQPRYGIGWHQGQTGFSSDSGLTSLPRGIATRFFTPWLEQFGVPTPSEFFGDAHE
ncbi:MAG: RNA polymerase sigma factor [Candidatus Dormibacteraceae bacterium]